jgi:hypothetical protein
MGTCLSLEETYCDFRLSPIDDLRAIDLVKAVVDMVSEVSIYRFFELARDLYSELYCGSLDNPAIE